MLLRDLHERLVVGGHATNALVIVPQFLDILTARVFKRHPTLLDDGAAADADDDDSSDSEDEYAPLRAPPEVATAGPARAGVGRTLCVHRNFLETAALTSSALSDFGVQTLRVLLGLDEKLGRHAVGPPCLRALPARALFGAGPPGFECDFRRLADLTRRATGALLIGWCRRNRDRSTAPGRLADRAFDYYPPVLNPANKGETLTWKPTDLLIVVAPPPAKGGRGVSRRASRAAADGGGGGGLEPKPRTWGTPRGKPPGDATETSTETQVETLPG